MKYIRTKDGIEKLDADREHLAKYMNGKQADTIEDLCDCYVRMFIKKSKGMKPMVLSDKNDRTLILNEHEDYGAIWTDKGLIYVAKMNEKGELELL